METTLRPRALTIVPLFAVCLLLLLVASLWLRRRNEKGWRWFLYFVLVLAPLLVSYPLRCYLVREVETFVVWEMSELPFFFLSIYCFLRWTYGRGEMTTGRRISLVSTSVAVGICCLALLCVIVCHRSLAFNVVCMGAMLIIITPFLFILAGEVLHHIELLKRKGDSRQRRRNRTGISA